MRGAVKRNKMEQKKLPATFTKYVNPVSCTFVSAWYQREPYCISAGTTTRLMIIGIHDSVLGAKFINPFVIYHIH